jgi:hypothetical protein
MTFVRCGDQHGVDVFPLHHLLETGAGVFDFQFIRNLFGPLNGDISDCNHFSNPENPELPHSQTPNETSHVFGAPFTDGILAL